MKWQLLSYVDHVKPQKRLPGLKVCPPLTNIEDGHEKITQQLNSKLTLKVSSDFGTCRSDGDWVGCQGDGRCSHNRAEQQPAQTETGLESGRHLDTDPARLQQSSTAVETLSPLPCLPLPTQPTLHMVETWAGMRTIIARCAMRPGAEARPVSRTPLLRTQCKEVGFKCR